MTEQAITRQESTQSQSYYCPACQRVYMVPAEWQAIPCPLCQQAVLKASPNPEIAAPIELIIPPALDSQTLNRQLSQFTKGSAFPHSDFKAENLEKRLTLVYWPVWLTDADLDGEWDAIFGYDYQVVSSREKMGNAGWSSQDVIKTRVKEEPRKGFLKRHYNNVLSPALHTHDQRLSQLGMVDLRAAHSWQALNTAQSVVQKETLFPHELEDGVKKQLTNLASADCRKASGAQHPKSYTFYGEFKNMNWTKGIVPMLTTYYVDDKGARHPIAINGQTGIVYGRRMASTKKAWLFTGILFALAIILMLVLYSAKTDLFLCPFVALGLVFAPIIYAAIWNNRERNKPPLA